MSVQASLPWWQVFEDGQPIKANPLAWWEFKDCMEYLERNCLESAIPCMTRSAKRLSRAVLATQLLPSLRMRQLLP